MKKTKLFSNIGHRLLILLAIFMLEVTSASAKTLNDVITKTPADLSVSISATNGMGSSFSLSNSNNLPSFTIYVRPNTANVKFTLDVTTRGFYSAITTSTGAHSSLGSYTNYDLFVDRQTISIEIAQGSTGWIKLEYQNTNMNCFEFGGELYTLINEIKIESLHTHSWSPSWSTNDNYHWHTCTAIGCSITNNTNMNGYGAHAYGEDITKEGYFTCNTCGYINTTRRATAFSAYKSAAKTTCEGYSQNANDYSACADTINNAKAAIDSYAYVDSISYSENCAAITKIATNIEDVLKNTRSAAFDNYKNLEKTICDSTATNGDSDACLNLIADEKDAIDKINYDHTKTYAENAKDILDIVTLLITNLKNQREADFGNYKTTAANVCDEMQGAGDSEACSTLISTAKGSINAINYNHSNSYTENKAVIDSIAEALSASLKTQREADFAAYKPTAKAECNAMAAAKDSRASKALIANTKVAIDSLKYDHSIDYDNNMEVLQNILSVLTNNLADQREYETINFSVASNYISTLTEVEKPITVNLAVNMPLSAVQFTVTLPEGVSVVEGSVQQGNILADGNFNVNVNKNKYGQYVFVVTSNNAEAFKAKVEDASLLTFKVKADSPVDEGVIYFENILASTNDSVPELFNAVSAKIDYSVRLLVRGDADMDEDITVNDYNYARHYILEMLPMPEVATAEFLSVDANNDTTINVVDVQAIAALITGEYSYMAKAFALAAQTVEGLSIVRNGNELNIVADNASQFQGFQMDITLPAGVKVVSKHTDADHSIMGNTVNGAYRILVTSQNVCTFSNNVLATLTLSNDAYVVASNIIFANTNYQGVKAEMGTVTGVKNANADVNVNNGKYIKNGNIVIMKNGKQYNVNGQIR